MTDTTTTPIDAERLTTLAEAVRKAEAEYLDAHDAQIAARRLYDEKIEARNAARAALYGYVHDLTGDT